MPVEATATHAKGLLLAKLSINNSGEMFGLFVHSPDGKERELTADERLYNVMLSWATTEYFLFKNRPVNNQLRHKRLSTQSVDASQFQLNEPAPQARRVAKLAGFFGLAPSPTATTPIPESLGKNLIHQPSEYEDLQTIFNQLSNVTTSSSLQANLRRRKSLAAPQAPQGGQPPGPERLGVLRKEFTSSIAALSTTLYKEGWMEVLINPTAVNAKKPWTCVWAKLDGDVLTVFPNERDEAVAGTPTAGSLPDRAATRVRLQGCTVVTGEGVVSKRQFVFTVVEAAQSVGVAEVVGAAAGSKASPPPPTAAAGATTTSNDKPKSLVLATKSATEMIDWIDCIRTSARRRPPTTSFSASRDSMHDHSQHPSRKTSVPVPPRTSTHTSTRPSVAANNNTTSLIPTDLEDPSLLLPTSSSHASEDETTLTMADFELHRVIGRGKYAKVLLCSRKSTNNVYAIKVLNKRRSISSSLGDGGEGDANEEGRILRSIHHPFIVGLHYAFQSADRLYLVMEYINGGELYFHVSRFGRFGEERVRFYCAELVLALQCLHDKGIVYRDLKLENILLSREGHVKITDFGLSKQETEDEESDSEADMVFVVGTLEYLSPEVLEGYPHTAAADLWALGVVTFEMLCGYHPFHSEDREEIQANILESPVEFPEWVSPEAKDFIAGLLKRNPRLRLKGEAIRKHPFFAGVDWRKLFDLEVEVPFKPELTGDYDVSFFEAEFTEEAAVLTPDGSRPSLEDRGGYQEQQPHHGENDSSHAEEDVDARMRSID
ncbi:kinase-like domain-containing protein [Fimicolochytrium jonesii]|uniref:kinase-like domain-containing protein n=1 Tax=Fimicolochytrium jonesii TaxID=1396493 RepID=UPI0022FDCB38|nr:kinase-like domain-containing protein [Fimicolochytrium jonesii]KAI8823050.1 kinase-like domain-containing protein [Fimicolochytrium jonesii]